MTNNEYYNAKLMEVIPVQNQLDESRKLLHQNLLVASGSLFGILISLHDSTGASLPCRLSFFLSLLLLGIGILAISMALHSDIGFLTQLKTKYLDEVEQARNEFREVRGVTAIGSKLYVVCERIGYICFFLSVIALCTYLFFVSFPELL